MTAGHRKEWWQQSIVRRTASFVKADLELVTSKSPFLQRPVQNEAAYFHRSEIITADQPLGHGGFSTVYEILGFCLSEQVSVQLTAEQNDMRLHYARTAVDVDTGRGRFVLKHLQERLLRGRRAEFSLAAADLALEVAYLERLKHDHIVSLRGLPVDGLQALEDGKHDGYFLILDRLQDTLDQRIHEWKQLEQDDSCSIDNIVRDKMEYARQLASACSYLHQHDIVFRDLKPQNIGFSQDGRIQLFDFGLCRELPKYEEDNERDEDDEADCMYEMSGVGTRRYMAPEIVNNARYNCKADVYSWSMVVWQMFALKKPYPHHSTEDHRIFVCQQGERPPLEDDNVYIPWILRSLLEESWCEFVADRFTMAQVCDQLASVLAETDIPIMPQCAFEPQEYLTVTTVTSEGIEVFPREQPDSSLSTNNFCLLYRLASLITCSTDKSSHLLSSSPEVSRKQQHCRDSLLNVLAIKPPGLAKTSSDESTCCILSDDEDEDDDDSSSQLIQLSLVHSLTM